MSGWKLSTSRGADAAVLSVRLAFSHAVRRRRSARGEALAALTTSGEVLAATF